MKRLLLWFAFVCMFHSGFSCLNEYEIIPGVEKHELLDFKIQVPSVYFDVLQEYKNEKLKEIKVELRKEHVDLVIALLYLHDYKTALEISESLLKKFPNEYNVVITYAAVLELNGNAKKAIEFIKKAVIINPDSHQGSEWIHLKILEDYLGINKNQYSVIGIDTGLKKEPILNNLTTEEKYNMLVQIAFQISERKYFINGNDISFGKLIFDYANLLYVNDNNANGFILISEEYFEMAIGYGFINELSEARYEHVKDWNRKKYHTKKSVPPAKLKSANSLESKKDSYTVKHFLRDFLPLGILGVLIFVLWYRGKFYYNQRKSKE